MVTYGLITEECRSAAKEVFQKEIGESKYFAAQDFEKLAAIKKQVILQVSGTDDIKFARTWPYYYMIGADIIMRLASSAFSLKFAIDAYEDVISVKLKDIDYEERLLGI